MRGKILAGVCDLQVDFECDHRDFHSKRIASKSKGSRKQIAADKKSYQQRAFRGKVPRDLIGSERDAFILHKARSRRQELGMPEKARRRPGVPTSVAEVVDAVAIVRRFLRLGRLPSISYDRMALVTPPVGLSMAWKRILRLLLIRAGIEMNPGPRYHPSSSSSSSSRLREDEKKLNCGGYQPRDDERINDKRLRGKKNFASQSLLSRALKEDAVKEDGNSLAAQDKAKEHADEEQESIRHAFASPRDAFIMRAGGFARPWYVGFGNPRDKLHLIQSMFTYLAVWWNYIRNLGELPLYDPRAENVWMPYSERDMEVTTPVFKGFAFSVIAVLVTSIFMGILSFVVWMVSLNSILAYVAIAIDWSARSTIVIQMFALLFRPLRRYMGGDIMMECGAVHVLPNDYYFHDTCRMPNSRFRPATDNPVLATVRVRTVSVADHSTYFQQFWATSWLVGSLFAWTECNRLISLVTENVDDIISLRLVDVIFSGLTRTRLDSYFDAEQKARNLAATYDELRLGVNTVDGRNVREDSIRYAAACYWSRQASETSSLNGVLPH
jgi:hypothetical protein